jgi:hypothetical protein
MLSREAVSADFPLNPNYQQEISDCLEREGIDVKVIDIGCGRETSRP